MTDVTVVDASRKREGEQLPGGGHTLWLVADHHRPQAHRHPLRALDHGLLLHRRHRHRHRAARAAHAAAAACSDRRPIQPAVHAAWHRHGLVLPGAVDPDHARQFPAADDDRRQGRRLSAPQPDVLVPVRDRRRCSPSIPSGPAASTPAGPSTRRSRRCISNGHVIAAAVGVFIVGFSSIATGVNFIVTIHMLRAPGMTWFRLPLLVWAIYATSIVMVLATPVLAMSLLLIMAERCLGVPIFDPGQWRRSAAVPAPVLVLQPPGGLHHDPAGHGRGLRDHHLLRPPPRLRLHRHGLFAAWRSP